MTRHAIALRPNGGSARLRVAVHDYSGHPFQVQLSRELARRGHDVTHLWCATYSSGKGALTLSSSDPAEFALQPVATRWTVDRQASWRRVAQELAYGRAAARCVGALEPDIVLSANVPLLAQQWLLSACRRAAIPFVFWQQDIYSAGMTQGLQEKFGERFGSMLGRGFAALEAGQLRRSGGVVVISDDFLPTLRRWGVDEELVEVIENWAPLTELPQPPRDNAWADEHGLVGRRVALYSGTLGIKHDPALLLDLARRFAGDPDARVVVVSEGVAADSLREQARREQLDTLRVLPFQPYDRLPDVLASADVLLAILEKGAGVYSVPSKILTYHCAGRPIVAALPPENLAARTIARAGSGIVLDPSDTATFAQAVLGLLSDHEECARLGAAARSYAVRAFAIEPIADRFEFVLRQTIKRRSEGRGTPQSGSRRILSAAGGRSRP